PSIGTHAHFAIQNDPRLVRLTPPTPTELTTLSLHDALPISGADIQIPNGHGGMVRTAGYTGEVWPHVVSWDPTSTEDFFDILKFTTDGRPYYPDIIATGLLDAGGLPVDGTYFRLEPILRAAGYRPEDYRIFPYDWRYSAAR